MHRKEQVISMIKQKIWPTTKFTSMRIVEETDLIEEGNFLSKILRGMNLTNYRKTRRAKFWNTYGKYILPELSRLRCNIQHQMKTYVVKGKTNIIRWYNAFIRHTILTFFDAYLMKDLTTSVNGSTNCDQNTDNVAKEKIKMISKEFLTRILSTVKLKMLTCIKEIYQIEN